MKKKVVSIMMTAALAAGMLAGCGNSDSGSSNAASGNDSKSTSEAGSTSASASGAAEEEEITTTLTVWSPSEDQASDSGEWLQTMCNQFAEEHPSWHITFDYGVCAESDAKDTVTQDVEGAADVYMFANDNLTSLIAANGISKLGGQTAEDVKRTTLRQLWILYPLTAISTVYHSPQTPGLCTMINLRSRRMK